ncbi:ABC transporter ATP-binding protein [Cupriavidus basilensis]|uniref:ABC transporter ATP-binding protein n=1 Tax=Cupriavidus basilensis TaxID=68895 RepID=UPI0007510386|nr:ABC transporter ATP-binding protein [Cupriavidus basilensis]
MSSDIRIEGVAKRFAPRGTDAARTILSQVDLTVRAGELVALVGPSGCGKSTLLNLIAGLDRPSQGRVAFDRSQDAISLSVVFQQPRLLDWLSVEENIGIVFEGRAVDAAERPRVVRELLRKVELSEHGRAYPQFLSGGQKQRVSIARAFAVQPDVLLLDEPFSALDELTARRLRSLLQSLWLDESRPRPTGVLVTHNMLEAAFLADRIAVMGGSPAGVQQVIEVDVPRPRHPDDPALFEVHRKVMEALQG